MGASVAETTPYIRIAIRLRDGYETTVEVTEEEYNRAVQANRNAALYSPPAPDILEFQTLDGGTVLIAKREVQIMTASWINKAAVSEG